METLRKTCLGSLEKHQENLFFCEIYFSGVYGALIPLTDSKNRFKSPHIAAFSIGNPIQNLLKISDLWIFQLRANFEILKASTSECYNFISRPEMGFL